MERQNIFLGAALLATIIATWLLWPYADAILWALFTAYFLHYFADHLNAKINNRTITTALMILLLVGFVSTISLAIITTANSDQITTVSQRFSGILDNAVDKFIQFFDLPTSLGTDLKTAIRGFTSLSSDRVINVLSELPEILINIVIYFVVSAFLVKDGKEFKNKLFEVLGNLPDEYRHIAISVVRSIDQLFRGVFLTYLTVALVVGALAAAGFYVMGVDLPLIWGLIIGIFAFFPVVSAPMVYVPLALLYISEGFFWWGVIILSYGVLVLNTLPEVLLRPYLASHQTQEHPLLLFVGFIIGPLVLGLKGIILGPMILVVTKNLLTMRYFEPNMTYVGQE